MDFRIEPFLPYLSLVVNELVRLLGEAETVEIKRRILGSLNTVTEQAGIHVSFADWITTTIVDQVSAQQIAPLIGAIAQPLPQLCEWHAALHILT